MKIIKQNKSLCFLLIVSFIYVFATIFFINPLREKNNKLEETKSEILISQQEQKYIQTFSQNKKLNSDDKLAEDIVLSIDKALGNSVDIISINKQYEQSEDSNNILLEVIFCSNLKEIFSMDEKFQKLNLDIKTMKIENSIDENNKKGNYICTIIFEVV